MKATCEARDILIDSKEFRLRIWSENIEFRLRIWFENIDGENAPDSPCHGRAAKACTAWQQPDVVSCRNSTEEKGETATFRNRRKLGRGKNKALAARVSEEGALLRINPRPRGKEPAAIRAGKGVSGNAQPTHCYAGGSAGATLIERFDVEPLSDFSAK